MSTNNKLMPIPFADKAGETYKYSIPNTNDTTYPNKATYENGFPAVTMTDIAAGGVPPFGQDFNGVLNDITTAIRYMQAGNYQLYNSDFATSIGGYSKGAVVLGSDSKLYESTIDSNTNDPISGTGWTLHLNYLPLTGGTLGGDLTAPNITANTSLTVGSAKATYSATGLNFDKSLLINGASVLKVGDGGVLSAGQLLTSLDDANFVSGFFITTSSTGGIFPTAETTKEGSCILVKRSNGKGSQLYLSSVTNKIYFRGFQDARFSTWQELITTANVGSYTSSGLGYDQTWRSLVIGTDRSNGVTYINNTSKPILVNIVSNGDGVGSWSGDFYVDGIVVGGMSSTGNYGQQKTISAIIPIGSEYRYSYTNNGIYAWLELR